MKLLFPNFFRSCYNKFIQNSKFRKKLYQSQLPRVGNNLVAILDAGAQYGKVLDRRIRSLAIESVILPMNTPAALLADYAALIISGGPQSVYSPEAPKYDPEIFQLQVPILGICYGMQLLAREAGAEVGLGARREDGPCTVITKPQTLLFSGLQPNQEVLMSHGDSVMTLPAGYQVIAKSKTIIAAIENAELRRYGVQFHPEVDLTEHGLDILRNFLFKIALLKPEYTLENRRDKAILEIQQAAGSKKVLMLVSGGVDSTVCAALITEALGADRVIAIHIDTGFMRLNENNLVKKALEANGLKLKIIAAGSEFFKALTQVTDPETKRQIIGDVYLKITEQTIADLGLKIADIMIAQGTLRPDLIESASNLVSQTAQKIKTHHNDSPAIRKLRLAGRVIEPLKDYHKDEVRALGLQLGLPPELIWRQPFPGPGLAIRVLCADKPFNDENYLRISEALKKFQTKATRVNLLPVKTVGVQGDGRTYSYLVGLSGEMIWPELIQLAREIPKLVHGVNRVAYIFGQPLTKIETEITPTQITPASIEQLRQADAIVNQLLEKHQLIKKLSQVPVISFPVNFGIIGNRSIAIRTFMTNDFMTGIPALPGQDIPVAVLQEMASKILKEVPGISRVVYDLTSKPPGTTEWE